MSSEKNYIHYDHPQNNENDSVSSTLPPTSYYSATSPYTPSYTPYPHQEYALYYYDPRSFGGGMPGSPFPSFPGPDGQQPGFPMSGFPVSGFPMPGFPQPGLPPITSTPQPGGIQQPASPPPSFIPQKPFTAAGQPFAVDPGAIRRCMFRFTYIWLRNGQQFWFFPIFVGPNSVAGFRWTGFTWMYFGIDLRFIDAFTC